MLFNRSGDPAAAAAAALAHDPDFVMGHCLQAALLVLSADEARSRRCAIASPKPDGARGTPMNAERRHIARRARGWSVNFRARSDVQRPAGRLPARPDCPARRPLRRFLPRPARHAARPRCPSAPGLDESMPGYGHVLGMYAFGLEETAHYTRAEEVARHALALDRPNPGAIHAVAHVMEMQGASAKGSPSWLKPPRSGPAAMEMRLIYGGTPRCFTSTGTRRGVQSTSTMRTSRPAPRCPCRPSRTPRPYCGGCIFGGAPGRALAPARRPMGREASERRLSLLRSPCARRVRRSGNTGRVEQSLAALRRRAAGRDPGAQRTRDIPLRIAEAFAASEGKTTARRSKAWAGSAPWASSAAATLSATRST